MTRLLLKGGEVLLPHGTVKQADVAIEDSIIAHVGDIPHNWQPETVMNCVDKLITPGLINTHTHAAMTLFRSYADDMALMDWLQKKIWPAEAKLIAEDVYWGTMLAIAEMLKSGTTTFTDMYFFMDEVAKAVSQSGIRAVLSRGMAGVSPTAEQALTESEDFFRNFHGSADGRITVMLGPHAPYTCPPDYLKKVIGLAEKLGVEIHIHLSETNGEVQNCLKEYGKSPIALMQEVGLFNHGVLAAHCVHVSAEDIAMMKRYNVRVAHNPGSNMKLASGVAPVPAMLSAGLKVGLGTDGASSNNNLDMLEEVRLAALLHKVHQLDPLLIPAKTAVDMATEIGAQAVGLGSKVGSIHYGRKADIVIWDMHNLRWYPRHDRISLLTYSADAHDVHTVIVNGRIVVENKQLLTIDEEKLMFEVQQRGMRLVN